MSDEVIGKLKTAIENEEFCKNCPTAERISSENLLGAMALGFSFGTDVARPQGEWIESFKRVEVKRGAYIGAKFVHDGWSCSECSEVVEKRYPNCPYCLARMKGADDEYR